ncbi:MAG: alpha-ketoglutarate-dependent dioxygenase AlkB [Acidimicrobiales bacterium]
MPSSPADAPTGLAHAPGLFDTAPAHVDTAFATRRRRELGAGAWVDVVPGWLTGGADLVDALLAGAGWRSRRVQMYDRWVDEPRLSCWGRPVLDAVAGLAPVLDAMADALTASYGAPLRSVGANLYRDGRDSVAWHGDRILREQPTALVAVLTLGATRPFALRPKGGGPSVRLRPGHGDLLVMGGTCQRTWDHAVPKAAGVAGPRISLSFRQRGLDPDATAPPAGEPTDRGSR